MVNDLKSVFRESAAEFLLELEQALLHLSNNPDEMTEVDRLFRVMHTIKGSAGMVDFDDVAKFAHKLESECDYLRQGQARVTPDLIHLALCAHDCISSLIDSHYGGEPVDQEHLEGILHKFAAARKAATVDKNADARSPEKTLELLHEIVRDMLTSSTAANRLSVIHNAGKKLTRLFFLILIQGRESVAEFLSQLEIFFRRARNTNENIPGPVVELALEMLTEAEEMYGDSGEISEEDFDPDKLLRALQRPLEMNQRLNALVAEAEAIKAPLPEVRKKYRVQIKSFERGPGALTGPDRFDKVLRRLGELVGSEPANAGFSTEGEQNQ